jgi:TPR repeat protein
VRFYRLAAEQGDAAGQANLGYMFFQGSGTAKDYEGVSWIRTAATNGNARAQLVMGYTSEPVDRKEAIRWFSLAAAQGCTEGADGLRRCRV